MYGGNVVVQKYSDLLEQRVKQPNESMLDLAIDIRKMVEVIYADCDSYVRENMAINYFVRSLPSIHITHSLYRFFYYTNPLRFNKFLKSHHPVLSYRK